MPQSTQPYSPIAITGIHGRFPAAQDTWQFWQNLTDAKDAIQPVPKDRWLWQDYDEETVKGEHVTYSHCAGFTPKPDHFDAKFFGILPREAEAMDPMQRLMLQTSWNALEDAGYDPHQLAGKKVGVFIGVGHADYPVLMRENSVPIDTFRGTGMALTAIANKVSFYFDFHGPSESIDTACSSSLVALHRGTHALREGECEMALVGGVNLLLGPELFIAFGKAGMLSREGRCQTFDNNADGYVRGEGAAAIVLTSLELAQQNNDYIYAILRGSAENHGGRAHSFTAPNVNAQAEVISQAWEHAGLHPSDANLIESHGTGTPLGDPIEINAIKKAIGQTKNPIAIGALKSHIGHLEAAAGIAGVIKTILSMQHQRMPGNLHFNQLNQHIDLEETSLFFPTDNQAWTITNQPLRAGISSFGFGGVNAHVVLESYSLSTNHTETAQPEAYLIPISAQDEDSLYARVQQLVTYLEEDEKAAQRNTCALLSQALQQHFHIKPDETPTLHQLNLSPSMLQESLSMIASTFDIQATLTDIRGCQNISELAERLATLKSGMEHHSTIQHTHLLCTTSIPRELICNLTLEQLSYTLLNGRSTLAQRIAFICKTKTELLATLRTYLLEKRASEQSSLSTTQWICGCPKKSSTEKPDTAEQTALNQLESWAHYWTSNKKALLSWQEVYPATAAPAKLPLPAYPFKLQRVWFKTPSETLQPTSTTKASALNCWHNICEDKSLFPSSLASLAQLVADQTETNNNALTNIVFGPPHSLTRSTNIEINTHSQAQLIQCLNSTTNQVLVQGNIRKTTANLSKVHNTPTHLQQLSVEQLYQSFAERGAVFPNKAHYVETAASTENYLELNFSPKLTSSPAPQWCSFLFSHLIAACKTLSTKTNALPYKIASITYMPIPDDRQISVKVYRASDTTPLDAQIYAGDKLIMQMTGLELRALPNSEANVEIMMEAHV